LYRRNALIYVYWPPTWGAIDALPSLRFRERERHEVLRVRRSFEARCGVQNAPTIKFCGECGKPLAAAAKEST
jgi:hypothetical protein